MKPEKEPVIPVEAQEKIAALFMNIAESVERDLKERLVTWALELGFATGHADTIDDLLGEVGAQIRAIKEVGYKNN